MAMRVNEHEEVGRPGDREAGRRPGPPGLLVLLDPRQPLPIGPWLDLEPLAAVLQPGLRARSLDEWMAAMGITCAVRHQAVADTLATAELLLKLWPALQRELRGAATDFRRVQALAETRRWLAR